MRRTALVLASVVLLMSACTTQPRMTPSERLEMYRAAAGEPVRGFQMTGAVWGWRALGDSALTVWPRNNQGFLLELAGPCIDLPTATSIELTNRTNRVTAFDSVIPRGHRVSTAARTPCRIRTIRPLNTQAIVEKKPDMHDVELIERDPSAPNDPNEGATQ